ncbi:MAG: PH domain-containing protein [Jiangellales bacterium]
MGVLRRLMDPDVDLRLVPGEHVIEEVRHVWVAFVWPVLVLVGASILALWSLATTAVSSLWLPLLVALLLAAYGSDRFLRAWRDRLVITDSRVMRVSGVYSRRAAWMPLSRVLDITVDRPLWLRPLHAGHLTLENAAQEQGLREFRFIPHPNRPALLIHGLRTGVMEDPSATPARPARADHPTPPTRRGVRRDGHHLT